MDKIERQVATARRRMVIQQFLGFVTWSLCAALLIALVGLSVRKIWVIQVDMSLWIWGWVGGSLVFGLLVAAVWTYFARRAPIEAAIEIDQRFQLKERVSSALSLSAADVQTEAGRALLDDAVRSVDRIDVRDSFPVRVTWHALLPFLPAALIFALVMFVPDAQPEKIVEAAAKSGQESEQVKRSAKELQKRLERAKEKASSKGLDDAELLFKQLQNGISDVANRNDMDRKKALVKINDLAQTIEQRRKRFGGADKMRDKLNQLKDLAQGPAGKITQAMKEGDFQKALDELKNLQDKLRNGELNAEDKQQLAEQLQQLQNKLQDMVNAHEQAKRDLQEEIQRKKDAGDLHEAGKLQQQLDALNQMNDQMNQLQKMAEGLGQCQQCMQNGDAQGAAAQLDQLAESLQDMQNELDQLETLNEMLDDIAMAKEAMNCQACEGKG
jgi:chemotaxis protein histidine kinase CheA